MIMEVKEKEYKEGLQDNKPLSKKGLSGSTLKLIAISAMLVDHVGAAILGRYLRITGYMDLAYAGDVNGLILWMQENSGLYITYTVMRMIGRIAFPIFAFLLLEGLQKTHNKAKYAMRLGVFALISEIPFDLAFSAKILEFSYQNVYFTLFFGVVVMAAFEAIGKKQWFHGKAANITVKAVAALAVLIFFCVIADLLKTDYGSVGVLCIVALYLFRKRKPLMILAGCLAFLWELTAPLAFIPIGFYNGRRGLKLKYVFYLFYPVHLFLIYLVCVFLGVAGYSAI